MKLLPAFSTLLLAVQLVGAVHMDQLQRVGFVKTKRTISQDGPRAERLQPSLQRRDGKAELVPLMEDMIKKAQNIAGSSEHASIGTTLLKDMENMKAKLLEEPASGQTHYKPPGYDANGMHPPNPYAGWSRYQPPSREFEMGAHYQPRPPEHSGSGHEVPSYERLTPKQLEKLNNAEFRDYGKKVQLLMQHSGEQDQALAHVGEYIKENNKRMKENARSLKYLKLGSGAALGATTITSVGGWMSNQDANNRLNDQQDQLNRANAEIARLKGGQQPNSAPGPGYHNGQAVGLV
ncbi:uncharacterized protein UTRI_00751 [Ustilago trichophora]|uniref:Uncharacterized protein n=1 Tax=Ustilago trichophora TaxID=86804 RepID=A0A5C3DS51_9BASI|nr:uncharacterized protein UTRI_00751 [Ustilago trichophora]